MADNTILQQGWFTSTGTDKWIPLRSDIDWMKVYNVTNIAGATQWAGCVWHWQRELLVGDALLEHHAAASQAISMGSLLTGTCNQAAGVIPGIYLYDSSASMLGAPIAVTAGTNATQPVYSTATTTALSVGTIVRVWGGAHTNINGLDFSIDTIVAATSFRLANTLATAPGVVNGAGFYRVVAPNAALYNMFYPSKRVIANITAANPAVVTTLVDHGYAIGQQVKISVPATCGMTQISGLTATITAVPTAATFTTDIDASTYTAFNYPLPAIVPFTPAEVTPVGDVSILGATTLSGAIDNRASIGVRLATSATAAIALAAPGGTNGDVIKWIAGKSFATFIP